jgi:hypothetical protein
MTLETPSTIETQFRHTGGVEVEYSGKKTWGHLDYPDEDLFPERFGVMDDDPFVTIAAGILPTTPVQDAEIWVDGTLYTVRRPPKALNDGRELRIWLGDA